MPTRPLNGKPPIMIEEFSECRPCHSCKKQKTYSIGAGLLYTEDGREVKYEEFECDECQQMYFTVLFTGERIAKRKVKGRNNNENERKRR